MNRKLTLALGAACALALAPAASAQHDAWDPDDAQQEQPDAAGRARAAERVDAASSQCIWLCEAHRVNLPSDAEGATPLQTLDDPPEPVLDETGGAGTTADDGAP